jgi:putative DNA primase/helicase
VWVFKWDTKITEAEADPALAYKLKRNEAQGILAWLVRGYQLWAKEGVSQPASMRKEVGAYRLEDDPFESFVQESLERVEPTGEGEEVWVATQELFNAYLRWCVNSNMRYPMNKLSFSKAMKFKKFEKKDKTAQRGFINVKVIKPPGDHWLGEGTPIFRYR